MDYYFSTLVSALKQRVKSILSLCNIILCFVLKYLQSCNLMFYDVDVRFINAVSKCIETCDISLQFNYEE